MASLSLSPGLPQACRAALRGNPSYLDKHYADTAGPELKATVSQRQVSTLLKNDSRICGIRS